MLPNINRLRKSKDYKQLIRNSRPYRFDVLSIRIAPNHKNISHVGIVVGVVVSKKAVVRNRLRRQLQEIVRLFLKDGSLKQGFDIMIRPDARALGCSYAELQLMLTTLLQKAGVYVGKSL